MKRLSHPTNHQGSGPQTMDIKGKGEDGADKSYEYASFDNDALPS